jgi:hypothetical protein
MTRKLTLAQVAERYGGVNVRTVVRWAKDEKLNFPQPMLIGKRPFWDEDILTRWDRDRARPRRPVTADS